MCFVLIKVFDSGFSCFVLFCFVVRRGKERRRKGEKERRREEEKKRRREEEKKRRREEEKKRRREEEKKRRREEEKKRRREEEKKRGINKPGSRPGQTKTVLFSLGERARRPVGLFVVSNEVIRRKSVKL